MRFAYADPPYLGQAKKHYGDQPTYAGEIDHGELIASLVADYPDGWALSCSTPSLQHLLSLCPQDVRVMAWVKPDAFAYWLFEVLNLEPGDILDDLYPGTGAIGRAWARWQSRMALVVHAP